MRFQGYTQIPQGASVPKLSKWLHHYLFFVKCTAQFLYFLFIALGGENRKTWNILPMSSYPHCINVRWKLAAIDIYTTNGLPEKTSYRYMSCLLLSSKQRKNFYYLAGNLSASYEWDPWDLCKIRSRQVTQGSKFSWKWNYGVQKKGSLMLPHTSNLDKMYCYN